MPFHTSRQIRHPNGPDACLPLLEHFLLHRVQAETGPLPQFYSQVCQVTVSCTPTSIPTPTHMRPPSPSPLQSPEKNTLDDSQWKRTLSNPTDSHGAICESQPLHYSPYRPDNESPSPTLRDDTTVGLGTTINLTFTGAPCPPGSVSRHAGWHPKIGHHNLSSQCSIRDERCQTYYLLAQVFAILATRC